MALSIKTKEADRLARTLSRLTGETMTEAVTKSLAERLERVRGSRKGSAERILAYAAKIRKNYRLGPVTKAEWDEASGDTE
ncbi:MAG: type II toxin-antitoxin system VapB family antitoxin [Alphaproteobacteria bacterium]|nr:type II toxin-antitoxin system VapB family antitoxin [Alphaproteobacteria bacterium]MBV9692380.1 type II toxin-antitoxin system VapB family antitoxin [Alphaproteobacteria bacterium]